jgi:hypothetical protein
VPTTDDDRPWWHVHAEAVGDEQYDEDLLEELLDNLLEHDGVVTGTPEEPIDGRARYGAGFSVQASGTGAGRGRRRPWPAAGGGRCRRPAPPR